MKKVILSLAVGVVVCGVPSAQAYHGKLQCDSLGHLMGSMSTQEVGRFCEGAVLSCEVSKMLATHAKDPFVSEVADSLKVRIDQDLHMCELAILSNDPDYYKENLRRPSPAQSLAVESPEREKR